MAERSQETISFTMSRIRGKNTLIELKLRKALRLLGIRYFVCSSKAFGHPDILIEKYKIAIFADSEFWHGYGFDKEKCKIRNNKDFWIKKIERNMARDKEVNKVLSEQGYSVLRFWGQEIEKDFENVISKIKNEIQIRKKIFDQRINIEEKTTLAYIEKDGSYLLLYRNKKKDDPNEGRYIGIGGHIEKGESVIKAFKREIKEETGLEVLGYEYKGKIDFINSSFPHQRMYLFKVTSFSGKTIECKEGQLVWINKSQLSSLPMWEGDRVFIPLLDEEGKPFRLTLFYESDNLIGYIGPFRKKEKKHGKRSNR